MSGVMLVKVSKCICLVAINITGARFRIVVTPYCIYKNNGESINNCLLIAIFLFKKRPKRNHC